MNVYKNSKLKRMISLFLVLAMVLISSIASVSATPLEMYSNSCEYFDPSENNGIYMIERLIYEGEKYVFTHSTQNGNNIIEISGAESHVIRSDEINSKIYLDEEIIMERSEVAFNSNISMYNNWSYFGPYTYYPSWYASYTSISIAAALSAVAGFGAPVAGFLTIAATLVGTFTSCTMNVNGRSRIEGTHVRGEYTAYVYAPTGQYLGANEWSGYR